MKAKLIFMFFTLLSTIGFFRAFVIKNTHELVFFGVLLILNILGADAFFKKGDKTK